MTAQHLLIAGILSVLTATSNCLSCIECTAMGDKGCNGSSKPCPSEDYSCLSTYGVTTIGGMVIRNVYIRQCGPSSLCSKTGSMSLPSGRFKSSVTCCDTDDCTPPDPILPEYSGDEEKKNGIRCPSCYVTNSKSCDLITVMDCIGNETMCMTQITDTEGPVPSTTMSRGCSTQGLCEPAQQVWKLGKMVVNVENACMNGAHCHHWNLLSLVICIYLFLKLAF